MSDQLRAFRGLPPLTEAEKRPFICPKCGSNLLVVISTCDVYSYSVDPLTGALKQENSKNKGYEEDVYCVNPACDGASDLPAWEVDSEEWLRWEEEEDDDDEEEGDGETGS